MANDINTVILIGRIVRDAQLTYANNGTALSKYSIAVGEKYKDKDETSFFSCTMFGKIAEGLSKYLEKGKQVCIQGKLKQDTWEKDGQKHERVNIIVNSVQLLGDGKTEKNQQTSKKSTVEDFDDSLDIPF